jgi:hypothetical protein
LFGFADSGSLALAEFDCAAKGSREVRGRLPIMECEDRFVIPQLTAK